MAAPTLATKLYIAPSRLKSVLRPRLVERMNAGMHHKLILISAPAGFGKTTLVSEWAAGCQRPIAWLSLDEGDNDPVRFITYLIITLQTIKAGIGESLLAALQSPEPPSVEVILTDLLNEIATIPKDFVLVLDDYHVVDAKAVDHALAFLLEHQPPQMHLIIATREDPSLSISRLRGRGQLTELRASDLRFTPAEAAEFLNGMMGLNLSDGDVAALETRTEGWVAGLQLAALSMQGQPDITSFIKSFTGSHRFVLDYLIEEVLQRQPETIQTFLLRTAILDRMCGPLCDAVRLASSASGQATLEYLEHANLFIVPLDNERRWYRYHHLFAELLRQRLGQVLTPECVAELHIRASEWYENNNLILDAFRHATAAHDIERAVRLMESRQMPIHLRVATTVILEWLETLPDTVRNARPVLWWKQAALILSIGQTTGVEEMLQKAEAALDAAVVSGARLDEATRDLIGRVAVTRASLAQLQIQIEIMFVQASRALAYLHPDNLAHRSSAICGLGYAYFWENDWDKAQQAYAEALALARTAGDLPNIILASIRLGQLQKDQNQLYLAAETLQHALQLLGDYSNPNAIVAYLNLAEIFYRWNKLDVAEQFAEQGLKLAQQYDQITDRIIMSKLHLVLIKLGRGDIPGAAQLVSQAEQISRQKNFTSRQPNIAYFQTWIYLQQGRLDMAVQLTRDNEIPLMRARTLIEQNEASAALEILGQLRQKMAAKGLEGRLLEVLVVQSVALFVNGDQEQAVELLRNVLARAEPAGWIRLFLDEGTPMVKLLSVVAAQGLSSDYVNELLVAFEAEKKHEWQAIVVPGSRRPHAGSSLVEPLSQRELDVLKLIARGLSNREISARLYLALDTVKGHNRRIFEKLQVQRRTEAVARARELGLL
jgi:LuxR family transcriptional regulator, maltose regulon positive regulatory protein